MCGPLKKVSTEQENNETMCAPSEFLKCRRRKHVEGRLTTEGGDEGEGEEHKCSARPQILPQTLGKRLVSDVDACAPPPTSQLGGERSCDSHPWGIPQGRVTAVLQAHTVLVTPGLQAPRRQGRHLFHHKVWQSRAYKTHSKCSINGFKWKNSPKTFSLSKMSWVQGHGREKWSPNKQKTTDALEEGMKYAFFLYFLNFW